MSGIDRIHAWAANAAPFALGVLDEDERRAFEGHLAACVTCQAEVSAYRDVVAQLAVAAPDHEPPPTLRQRVLADARSVRPIRTGRSEAPLTKPPRGALAWLAAASFGAALIASSAYLSERSARIGLARSIAELRDTVSVRDAERAGMLSAVAQRDSVLAAVLAPDVQTTRLTAAGRPPSVRLYWNRQAGRMVLAAFDLEPARTGRTYQLWGIADGSPVSLGTFNTADDGRVVAAWAIDASLALQMAAVTEEPAGGSPQPTSTPFLSGSMPR